MHNTHTTVDTHTTRGSVGADQHVEAWGLGRLKPIRSDPRSMQVEIKTDLKNASTQRSLSFLAAGLQQLSPRHTCLQQQQPPPQRLRQFFDDLLPRRLLTYAKRGSFCWGLRRFAGWTWCLPLRIIVAGSCAWSGGRTVVVAALAHRCRVTWGNTRVA